MVLRNTHCIITYVFRWIDIWNKHISTMHYLPKLKLMWYARHKWCSVHNSPRIAVMLKSQFNENPNWSPNIANIMLRIDFSAYNFNHEIQISDSLIFIKLIMKPWNDNRVSRSHNWKQKHEAKVNIQWSPQKYFVNMYTLFQYKTW